MLMRATIVLAWAGLGLQGCGGFLDPIAFRGTGGAPDAGAVNASGGNGGNGGSGGIEDASADGVACQKECILAPDGTGWVENSPCCPVCCPMHGAWYYYDDGYTQRIDPPPSQPSASVLPKDGQNSLCTKGITASTSDAGFANIWGAGIGLWLNQLNLSPGIEIYNPIGDLERMPIGFRFQLANTIGPNGLRVNFPYSKNDTVPHFVSVPGTDLIEVLIENARQGDWVLDASTIDPARVVAIQFAIPAGPDPVAFDFCVKNLTAIFAR
jgi:hypothetical protein